MSNLDREGDKKGRSLTIVLPNVKKARKERLLLQIEKTSLYVPRLELFEAAHFSPSTKVSDQVLVTHNPYGVLEAVFKHGKTANRFGKDGLESDPLRQQVLIYTAIRCKNHYLWYQRNSNSIEKRLQGRYSMGFAGHKTHKDIKESRDELIFLEDLLPVIRKEIGTILGLHKGFFSEVEEELGLIRQDFTSVNLLGAFHDMRFEDPHAQVQVGWVHTGIAAVLDIDEYRVSQLHLRKSEIAQAWWIPEKQLLKEYESKQKAWTSGKGPKVESWTEILIKEFLA